MRKVYVAGWDGPWGWVSELKTIIKAFEEKASLKLVDTPEQAEVVFQADMTNWMRSYHAMNNGACRVLICNVLDLAEWTTETGEPDPDILDYIKAMKKVCTHWVCISPKVVDQLSAFGINAELFYYPSAFSKSDWDNPVHTGSKMFLTYGRLGDPGKCVDEIVAAFEASGLAEHKWKYVLAGPEPVNPSITLPKGMMYVGYQNTFKDLRGLVDAASFVVMASKGEGLGLPPLEAMIAGKPFIARRMRPITDIWTDDYPLLFDDSYPLVESLKYAAAIDSNQVMDKILSYRLIAEPWVRDHAISNAIDMLRSV